MILWPTLDGGTLDKSVASFQAGTGHISDNRALRPAFRSAGQSRWLIPAGRVPRFDRTLVFRELLRRPYWLNTVRFYGCE
jgi:hypothetical protein